MPRHLARHQQKISLLPAQMEALDLIAASKEVPQDTTDVKPRWGVPTTTTATALDFCIKFALWSMRSDGELKTVFDKVFEKEGMHVDSELAGQIYERLKSETDNAAPRPVKESKSCRYDISGKVVYDDVKVAIDEYRYALNAATIAENSCETAWGYDPIHKPASEFAKKRLEVAKTYLLAINREYNKQNGKDSSETSPSTSTTADKAKTSKTRQHNANNSPATTELQAMQEQIAHLTRLITSLPAVKAVQDKPQTRPKLSPAKTKVVSSLKQRMSKIMHGDMTHIHRHKDNKYFLDKFPEPKSRMSIAYYQHMQRWQEYCNAIVETLQQLVGLREEMATHCEEQPTGYLHDMPSDDATNSLAAFIDTYNTKYVTADRNLKPIPSVPVYDVPDAVDEELTTVALAAYHSLQAMTDFLTANEQNMYQSCLAMAIRYAGRKDDMYFCALPGVPVEKVKDLILSSYQEWAEQHPQQAYDRLAGACKQNMPRPVSDDPVAVAEDKRRAMRTPAEHRNRLLDDINYENNLTKDAYFAAEDKYDAIVRGSDQDVADESETTNEPSPAETAAKDECDRLLQRSENLVTAYNTLRDMSDDAFEQSPYNTCETVEDILTVLTSPVISDNRSSS